MILITGAGGVVGKAFIRLLKKHEIIALDNNEWAVAELQNEFPKLDVRLKDFEKWRFNQIPCDLVIHCAAYKHVNLGENNPHSFIQNNLEKTGKLFAEAFKHNVEILFISSDKAVEPISVYGFTKALGEKLAWHYNGKVVRLGNVLGSYGSVIPAWEDSIKNKKPIKITDMEMSRYVIEDTDAVEQIWTQYRLGQKLIIPICQEVNIMTLLNQVLQKHGFNDIKDYKPGIKVIGIRPGEKLKEKLRWDYEV